MTTIVARLQMLLFWLFDFHIRTNARQGHLHLFHPFCLILTRLWVNLIDGDLLQLHVCPQHDLTHLALGLGVSFYEEILVDISEPYLFGQTPLPDVRAFEREFMSARDRGQDDIPSDFWENCRQLLALRPLVESTHRRLETLLQQRQHPLPC
jgi:hypothetical protein